MSTARTPQGLAALDAAHALGGIAGLRATLPGVVRAHPAEAETYRAHAALVAALPAALLRCSARERGVANLAGRAVA